MNTKHIAAALAGLLAVSTAALAQTPGKIPWDAIKKMTPAEEKLAHEANTAPFWDNSRAPALDSADQANANKHNKNDLIVFGKLLKKSSASMTIEHDFEPQLKAPPGVMAFPAKLRHGNELAAVNEGDRVMALLEVNPDFRVGTPRVRVAGIFKSNSKPLDLPPELKSKVDQPAAQPKP